MLAGRFLLLGYGTFVLVGVRVGGGCMEQQKGCGDSLSSLSYHGHCRDTVGKAHQWQQTCQGRWYGLVGGDKGAACRTDSELPLHLLELTWSRGGSRG